MRMSALKKEKIERGELTDGIERAAVGDDSDRSRDGRRQREEEEEDCVFSLPVTTTREKPTGMEKTN